MNRLRGKKKLKDEGFAPRPSMESEPSGPFRMFSKKKSQDDEPKKEVDLAAVLPPSDDFRTSLLMTGLSARFSMLREQDDPHSKLGKASDDSVLFPKRHSRLGDFGLGATLPDITEIESVKTRPFARADSYVDSDDAASTNDSIMNRAKPTEGNNLFGGRQKIYKIPVGGTGKGGAMGGKALYEDDVAHSAFQRWRQAEKERQSLEQDHKDETADSDVHLDYNRRRETSSTTSSIPSVARSSTAATSVASSQPASVKDWPPNSVTATSASQASALERNVMRTRRLYEQGLSQDLHEQQSSALSRMDTLSRPRPFGTRTPELTPLVPSPTSTTFGDRVLERRPIVSKASAPNLRSFSPPTAGSAYMMSPPEPHGKFSQPELKPSFGGNPPLSPPVSEAEDNPALPIQPKDRGKATAMGVFNRPAQQYDESKYAQRQRQLQHGRETPTGQASESNSVAGASRSASSASRRGPLDKTMMADSAAHKESRNPTFFDDSDDASVDNHSSLPSITPQLTIERPDDQDHPALRGSALPTPMSFTSMALSDDAECLAVKPGELGPGHVPLDSPTLGPNAGLSGMVRQHLRHDSTASSVSGATDRDSVALPTGLGRAARRHELYSISDTENTHQDDAQLLDVAPSRDQDEFARHLADGARRVRERLTTFVETDSAPPTPLPEANKDASALRPNGLGILRSKSSRGSLRDRDDQEPGHPKTLKAQVPVSMSVGATASPYNPLANARDDGLRSSHQGSDEQSGGKEDNAQAGLKAFRQARRELQKMKELETRQRHQTGAKPPTGAAERTPPKHLVSQDGFPPPALLNRRPRDESRSSNRSSEGSHMASEPRDRSGSEASTVTSTYSRGTRHRNGSATYDEQLGPYGHGGLGRSSPSMGAAGFAGADTRPSPPCPTVTAMSPSHSTGAIDGSGRRMGRKREVLDGNAGSMAQPYGPYRNGSSPSTSTPNLHAAAAAAPPLPPINPRRKNGLGALARPPPHGAPGGGDDLYGTAAASEDEGLSKYQQGGARRVMADSDGRARQGPPTVSQANMTRGGLPGGMF